MNKSLLAIALAAAGLTSAHANLVVNGDFETPAIGSGTYGTFTSIAGWTGAPTIEIQNHIAGTPFSGNNLVELDTDANSAMFQDIATVAGQAYTITFAYSARPGIAASSTGIDFLWNGAVVQDIAQSGLLLSDTSWSTFSFIEVATGATSRIGFAATGTSDSYGGYLDAVTADALLRPAAMPEPATWSLFGAGLALAVASKRRRAKR